ncbi:MerR family transcriptional regulator [Kribbella deserti]|uniref:MerR family transcriptional regulator n=1 Tax=Kribbella deserti TaxID=1926257 RepID=A0ABV6R0J2_9ACTN
MRIGELADRTGVSVRALRYYEEAGLLHPGRCGNGYREFSEDDVARVWQIQWLFSIGLCSGKISTVLPMVCGTGDAMNLDPALADEVADTRELIAARVAELAASLDRLDHVIELARRPQAS